MTEAEILEAKLSGKNLEYSLKDKTDWKKLETLVNMDKFDFRITSIRPWKPEEAIGKVVRRKNGDCWFVITEVSPTKAFNHSTGNTYQELLENWVQLGDLPCGVKE